MNFPNTSAPENPDGKDPCMPRNSPFLNIICQRLTLIVVITCTITLTTRPTGHTLSLSTTSTSFHNPNLRNRIFSTRPPHSHHANHNPSGQRQSPACTRTPSLKPTGTRSRSPVDVRMGAWPGATVSQSPSHLSHVLPSTASVAADQVP